ncbi:hypothetical protein ACFX10_013155 [Malus domestica]
MIVASSVGLLKKIDEAKLNKEKDVDYLSSIEVLVIDHAVVVTMQNWDFLKSAVEQLNRIPSKQHGTDVMRIRPWYLDGCAHFYRQTILLSYYSNPDINNLFSKHCNNYHGKVKLVHEHKGVLPEVILQVRQVCLIKLSFHLICGWFCDIFYPLRCVDAFTNLFCIKRLKIQLFSSENIWVKVVCT